MCLCGAALVDPGGKAPDRPESEVKAALVYKFVRYLSWAPERFDGPRAPLVLGVYGDGPMAGRLAKTLDGKKNGDRPIQVVRFEHLEDVRDCHVLYVTEEVGGDSEHMALLFARIAAKGVCVIGESDDFAHKGGVINFYIQMEQNTGKVRFEINPDEAKRREIGIRSDLLKLARIVRDKRSGGDREQESEETPRGSEDRR